MRNFGTTYGLRSLYRLAALLGLLALAPAMSGCYYASIDGGMIIGNQTDRSKISGEYTTLSNFQVSTRAGWAIFALIPLLEPAGSNSDWTYDVVNQQISQAGGDAAINIHVVSHWDVVDVIVNFLLGWIGNISVYEISGTVIRFDGN
jgi:hypothetical protein